MSSELGSTSSETILSLSHYQDLIDPTHQWPDGGSFELEKLLYLTFFSFLESSYPKQLSYWYLWKDQIKKWMQRSITASPKDSLDNMKKQKLHSEGKLGSISNVNSTLFHTYLSPTPCP